MTEQNTKAWFEGFHQGEESVFEFLEQMQKVPNPKELEAEYKSWANADEVTLPNGKLIKRYE